MLGTVLINSCSSQQNAKKKATIKVATAISNPIVEVYADYIGMKNSLTNDNADSAAAYAKNF